LWGGGYNNLEAPSLGSTNCLIQE